MKEEEEEEDEEGWLFLRHVRALPRAALHHRHLLAWHHGGHVDGKCHGGWWRVVIEGDVHLEEEEEEE